MALGLNFAEGFELAFDKANVALSCVKFLAQKPLSNDRTHDSMNNDIIKRTSSTLKRYMGHLTRG